MDSSPADHNTFWKQLKPTRDLYNRFENNMILANDELVMIFSYLPVQENIGNLNLVCKQWYTITSIDNGQDTLLWKQWYISSLNYYLDDVHKNYQRKKIEKRAKKKESRDYRVLMRQLIPSLEECKTKHARKIHEKALNRLIYSDTYDPRNAQSILALLDSCRNNKQRFTRHLQENEGKQFLSRLLYIMVRRKHFDDHAFTELAKFVGEMNVPFCNELELANAWKSSHDIVKDAVYCLLPTQILILFGKFNQARTLHEKYGCPLSLQITNNVTLTSMNVLLCHSTLQSRRNEIKSNYRISEYENLLRYLIRVEGIPSTMVEMSKSLTSNILSDRYDNPISCLVYHYPRLPSLPLMRILIENGGDINGDNSKRSPLEYLYELVSSISYISYVTCKTHMDNTHSSNDIWNIINNMLLLFAEHATISHEMARKWHSLKEKIQAQQSNVANVISIPF